jgi:exonuclease VII small subunit
MSKICSQQLDQAEKKIEKLIREKDGEFQTEILQEPEETDDRESVDDELPF